MDRHQRGSMNTPKHLHCHECNGIYSQLPLELLEAVQHGNVDMIKDYIDKDQDINAWYEGESLLSRACAEGHVEIVKLLLQYPEIHLNALFKESTPLMRAAQNGHLECVRLLLDSSLTCAVNLDNCRNTVTNFLKTQPEIKQRSALHILNWALFERYLDVVQLILQTDHHYRKEDLYPLIMIAVEQERWDIICDVFKRDFYGKIDLINEVFSIAVRLRFWERVEKLIHMMDGELKLELPFVEAALAGKVDEVKRLLAEKQYDAQTLNGSLLVVASGGTTEPVAELLLTIKNIYTKRTLSDALFLAALGDCAEVFICLLSNLEASYSINDIYRANGILTYHSLNEPHKGFLVTFFTNYLNKFKEIKLGHFSH